MKGLKSQLLVIGCILVSLCSHGGAQTAPIIETFAGDYSLGPGYSGDGGPANKAQLNFLNDIVQDAEGNFYISDSDNYRIRKVTPKGIISTYAGNGTDGYSGDGGPATQAALGSIAQMALDPAGNLYLSQYDFPVVRKIAPDGTISTYAGDGTSGYSGDGGPATKAQLANSYGLAVDAAGDLYIADFFNSVIRKVTPGGTISTFAGNHSYGFSGDGDPATEAQLTYPCDLSMDAAGNLYIADLYNERIRKVTPGGIISTVAGNGGNGYSGDGGPATQAQIWYIEGVYANAEGDLYIGGSYSNVIRFVSALTGTITTVAGDGYSPGDRTGGFSGDGGPATQAELDYPTGVTLDAAGNLYIADDENHVIRRVNGLTAASPVFSPAGGTYYSPQSVEITSTPGAAIYYTTNGQLPTAASKKYTTAISVTGPETITAVALTSGNAYSSVASATYSFTVAKPTFSPEGGTYPGPGPLPVTITDATPGATIYCTTDGSTPTISSKDLCAGTISVTMSNTTIKAIAAVGSTESPEHSGTYLFATAKPAFTPEGSIYPFVQLVGITDSTTGAVIYYTTDGSTPTTSSTKYTTPIPVAVSGTIIKAIAQAPGYAISPVHSGTYVIIGSPSALAYPATDVSTPDATLNAIVNTLGLSGSYFFKYGTNSLALASSTTPTALSASTAPVNASAQIKGLASKVKYYFQVVVTTAGGSSSGAVLSFTTN